VHGRGQRQQRADVGGLQVLGEELAQRGAAELRVAQQLVGLKHAGHLIPGRCHQRRSLALDDLRAHAGAGAVARVEVEIGQPARDRAVHRRDAGMPPAVGRRHDPWVL
jgi:hypothetical protein